MKRGQIRDMNMKVELIGMSGEFYQVYEEKQN